MIVVFAVYLAYGVWATLTGDGSDGAWRAMIGVVALVGLAGPPALDAALEPLGRWAVPCVSGCSEGSFWRTVCGVRRAAGLARRCSASQPASAC
jgi:hypothetical protein